MKRVDKVIQKIEAHKAAFEAYEATCGWEDNFAPELDRLPRVHYSNYLGYAGEKCEPMYLHTKAAIREEIAKRKQFNRSHHWPVGGFKVLAEKWIAELEADAKALKRAQDKAGYTAAKDAFGSAEWAETRTFDALLKCRPSTPLGIKRLTKYLAAHWGRKAPGTLSRHEVVTALRTIDSALAA